MTSIAGLS